MNKDKLTFNTDRTIFTGGTISSVTAGLTVLEKTALFKTSPLRERQSVWFSKLREKLQKEKCLNLTFRLVLSLWSWSLLSKLVELFNYWEMMFTRLVTSVARKKKILSPQTFRFRAPMPYHWATGLSMISEIYYEVHMTCVLYTARISNVNSVMFVNRIREMAKFIISLNLFNDLLVSFTTVP